MAIKTQRKNLGRGLSALIPDADMAFLSQVARGEPILPVSKKSRAHKLKSGASAVNAAAETNKTVEEVNIGSEHLSLIAAPLAETMEINPQANDNLEFNPLSDIKIDFISLNLIEANPYQPRRFFSAQELEDLTVSIREHGLLQPIILRPLPSQDASLNISDTSLLKYQLVAGERRWRAAQSAGLTEIPAIVRELSDQQALELALIENVQRHDISALDAAVAYRRLLQEFSLSQEQVAQRVGKSRSSIANTIRLLDLPDEAQKAIEEGILSEGHGRAILLASSDGARRAVLRRILRDKLSVRDTEELARQTSSEATARGSDTQGSDEEPLPKTRLSPEAKRIEDGLQKYLGTRVKLKLRRQGGQVLIHYFSNEELDRLLRLIMK